MTYWEFFIKQEMCPNDLRKYIEKKSGRKMKFVSVQDELVTTEEINKEIDKILKEKK
jgi:hypothetical protein